jgi:hypothetical protein
MKRIIKMGVLSIIFFNASALQAQGINDERRDAVEFGVKVGANVSNVWDAKNQEFTADSKAGLAGGLFVGIPIGEMFGVQPEILFSQKGFQASGTILTLPYSLKRTTSYIDIPLQLQVKPTNFLTLLAGPQFSYLLKQKDEYTFNDNSSVLEQEFENDNVRKNILGFVAGADVILKSFVLSARVGWDFQNNNGDGTSVTPRYKNQWLQFTVGFKI